MALEKLVATIKARSNIQTIAIAHSTDISLIQAAKQAIEKGIASFIFVGPVAIMETLVKEAEFTDELANKFTFVNASTDKESARQAVQLVAEGKADALMKGMLATSTLLKAVLNKEMGLRTGKVLSHLAAFSFKGNERLLFLTDAAMNIAPDLKEKVEIVQNAVDAVRKIGIDKPKVAALAAVETVNPSMQATLDAASLTQMSKRGQITDCVVDGPLGLDNAISEESASQKGISSEVAGRADILMAPSIEVGNVLYKSLTYFGGAVVGGIIVGAKAPIILTSRTDKVESKLLSMALAISSIEVNR
ncbi:MAG: bifunctional enoyl-CoA hydratase/phosphate acetyltransferase [Bacillus sp. (in: Bacteria)]|nr:bifunctional enoyl-CoA hydratase/phosphate acetyltransferase [Bacillus sp. (in: firmicutes)]